mgnify:CR=1 FL=1
MFGPGVKPIEKEIPINNNNKSVLNNINDANLIKIDIDLKYNKRDKALDVYRPKHCTIIM